MIRRHLLIAAFLLIPALPARADHLLDHMFPLGGSRAVPMDIQSVELSISFDAAAKSATGTARIVFAAPGQGRPYFTMNALPLATTLDGIGVEVDEVATPDENTKVRVLAAEAEEGNTHTLELTYSLSRRDVRLGGGRVGFLTAMNDIGDRGYYFEAYGPSNIEADAYAMTLILNVTGASVPPQLFTNGQTEELSADPPSWRVTFPDWYTTSSFYVHLTNSRVSVLEDTVQGIESEIPVTVYARSPRKAQAAMDQLDAIFQELEATYGPYLHASFVVLVSGRGGMEHCGATVSDLGSLAHELTHSWFARGVMPSAGRDGWMDEAIASWRDYGYERYEPDPLRDPTNMAGFTVFHPFAPGNVYDDGRSLLAEIDAMVAPTEGGLRPVLARWYMQTRAQAVSTEDFQAFLEADTGLSFASMFDRFVYGTEAAGPALHNDSIDGGHPPRLTRAEIRRLR